MMKIKDGLHLPTKKFPENFDGIFRKKKMKRLSPQTTKQFLEGLNKK